MRPALLTLTALAVVGLAAGTALAGHGYRGYGSGCGSNSYGNYGDYRSYGSYGNYGCRGNYRHYGSRGSTYSSRSHVEAVKRVQANYSRGRYNPHPRSNYTTPPYRYGYRGW